MHKTDVYARVIAAREFEKRYGCSLLEKRARDLVETWIAELRHHDVDPVVFILRKLAELELRGKP